MTKYLKMNAKSLLTNPYILFWSILFIEFWVFMYAYIFGNYIPQVEEAVRNYTATSYGNLLMLSLSGAAVTIGSSLLYSSRSIRFVTKYTKLSPSSFLFENLVSSILALLAMAKQGGMKLSELPNNLPQRYTASDRLQAFPSENSQALLRSLASSSVAVQEFLDDCCGKSTGRDQTDGLRLQFANGEILHLRPSGNAPELRCYAEADTQVRADELVRTCLSRIRGTIALPLNT